MVHVLHLLDRQSDFASERTADSIRKAAGADFTITTRTVGRGGDYRSAGQAALALRFGRGPFFDVVHAFDLRSLLAACGGPSPIVFSPALPPSRSVRWLKAAMVYRKGMAIATTRAFKHRLERLGVPPFRCDVIDPPVDPARIPAGPNPDLRRELGFAPDDRVLLAPGESFGHSGHFLALHTVAVLHVLDPKFRLLLWGRGQTWGEAMRLARKLGVPGVPVVADEHLGPGRTFEELTQAADLALVTATANLPSLTIAICMAAGLPIVSAATPATSELLEDGRTASLVPRLAPRLLGERILSLIEDPERANRLGDAARTEALRRFDPHLTATRFLSRYRHAAGVSPKGAEIRDDVMLLQESGANDR